MFSSLFRRALWTAIPLFARCGMAAPLESELPFLIALSPSNNRLGI